MLHNFSVCCSQLLNRRLNTYDLSKARESDHCVNVYIDFLNPGSSLNNPTAPDNYCNNITLCKLTLLIAQDLGIGSKQWDVSPIAETSAFGVLNGRPVIAGSSPPPSFGKPLSFKNHVPMLYAYLWYCHSVSCTGAILYNACQWASIQRKGKYTAAVGCT